jgi:glycosyltransferase involved in cell wall biosynthesis
MSIVLSVSCITYNHALYIRDCLDGFLMQKTTFPIEVIIHDDCSTDGTKEIIEEYAAKYPDIIFPMFQTENQYSKGIRGLMARFNFPRCRGKYIALCEGDDYWTDSSKLQKQVDFLEMNSDYSMCFHDALNVYTNKKNRTFSEKYPFLNLKTDFTQHDLIHYQWFIPTASMLFRNFGSVPDYFFKINAGDYNLQMFLSKMGKIHYLPESMSVYRITSNGLGTVNLNPMHRINDLQLWLGQVKSVEKKYILRRILANYRLLFKRDIRKINSMGLIYHLVVSIKTFMLYVYYLLIHILLNKQMINK